MAESRLPPSKFGAGFTVGAGPLPAPTPVGATAAINRLAVFTFVAVMVLGIVVAPITLALAAVSTQQIRQSGQNGAGLATAAKILSAVYLFVGLVVAGLWFYLRIARPG